MHVNCDHVLISTKATEISIYALAGYRDFITFAQMHYNNASFLKCIGTYMRSCARSFVLGFLQLRQNNLPYSCIDKHAQTDPYQLAKRSVPAGSRSLILNMINPHHVDARHCQLAAQSQRLPSSPVEHKAREKVCFGAIYVARPRRASGELGDGDGEAQAAVLQAPTWARRPPPRVMTRSPAARSVKRSAAATPPSGRPVLARGSLASRAVDVAPHARGGPGGLSRAVR